MMHALCKLHLQPTQIEKDTHTASTGGLLFNTSACMRSDCSQSKVNGLCVLNPQLNTCTGRCNQFDMLCQLVLTAAPLPRQLLAALVGLLLAWLVCQWSSL